MKKFLIVALASFNLFFISISAQTRITGGGDINIEQVPWQTLIKINDEFGCGGSIITPDYILTAKHCATALTSDKIHVITGVTCKSEISQSNIHNVSQIILHPSLDVALLRLDRPILFNGFQQPIDIIGSLNTHYYQVDNSVRVSGWGWLTPNGYDPSRCLQAVDVGILSDEDANEMLNEWGLKDISVNEIATIGIGSVRQGACHGDSGGPLVIRDSLLNKNILLGIVSWGINACQGDNTNSPSVYLRTSSILNWVYENICSISGPSTICDQATYTIQNLPQGATVQWSLSNTNLRLVSAQDSTAVFRRNGDGNSSIQASVFVGNDTIAQLNKPNIIVGNPQLGVLHFYSYNGETYWCSSHTGNRFEIEPFDNTNYTSYETYLYRMVNNTDFVQVGHSYLPMPGEIQLSGLPQGWYLLKARGLSGCGVSEWMESEVEIKDCMNNFPHPFSLSPNPANDIVTLRWDEGNSSLNKDRTTQANSATYEVQLWSTTALVRKFKTDQPTVQIPLNGLSKGMYFVHVIKDGKTYRQKLIVN